MPQYFSTDDLYLTDTETVSFSSVVGGAVAASVTGIEAERLAIDRGEVMSSGGFFDGSENVFWIAASLLGGLVPKEGDYVTDAAGVNWYAAGPIKTAVMGSRYRLVCKKQR